MTRDEGRSWSDVAPQRVNPWEHFDDVLFLGPTRGWAVAGDCNSNEPFRVYRTQDGGATWRASAVGQTTCNAGAHMELEFVDARHGWLLHVEPTAPFQTLQRTRDGGRSWTRPIRLPTLGDVHFHGPLDGWLQGNREGSQLLFATHDGGRTWTRVKVPRPNGVQFKERVFEVPTFFGDASAVLPVTMQIGPRAKVAFYLTSNGGETWSLASVRRAGPIGWYKRLPFRAPIQTHVFGPATWLIVSGGSSARRQPVSIHITRDGGRSWTTRGLELPRRGWLEFQDPRTAWLIPHHDDRIYLTSNGGRTWRFRKVAA